MSRYSIKAKEIFEANSIMCLPGSKHRKGPAIRGWTNYVKNNPTNEIFEGWLSKYADNNLCLPLGQLSGIVCVDVDLDEDKYPVEYGRIKKLLSQTPLKKIGKKGFSAFYRYNLEDKKQYFTSDGDLAVEILSDGNVTDIPPSIHPDTKEEYYYSGEAKFTDKDILKKLPELPQTALEELEKLFSSDKVVNEVEQATGRQDKLKRMAIAGLNSGKSVRVLAMELLKYDQLEFKKPYFSDQNEFGANAFSPRSVSINFVSNIQKTLQDEDDFSGIRVYSLEDVEEIKSEKQSWLVDNLLPETGLSLLVASPKEGKSQLSRYLLKCVLHGDEFLGRDVKKGGALLGLFEEIPQNVKPFLDKLGITKEDNLKIVTAMPELNPFLSLTKLIQKTKPSFVVIDTLQTFLRIKDINNYSEVTPKLNELGSIACEANTHILLIHHSRKGGDGSSDSILGSQGLFAGVDTLMQIHKQQGSSNKFFSTRQRYSASDFSSAVLIQNPKNLHWSSYPSIEDFNLEKARKEIRKYLFEKDMTEPEILEEVTGKTTFIKEALRTLLDRNEIKRVGEGKRGNPYIYSTVKKGNKELQKKTVSSSKFLKNSKEGEK